MSSVDTKPKCPYSKDDLKKWKAILLTRRSEILGDIDSLEHSAMDMDDGHIAPTHQADRGSDADMQDNALRMAENEKVLLWQINRALHKLEKSDPLPFGLCEHTQKAIPKTRLGLLPWTPLSIEGAEYMEQEGLTLQDMVIED